MAKATPEPGLRFRKHADKSEGERVAMLVLPGLPVSKAALKQAIADSGDSDYVALPRTVIAPTELEKILVNPATPGLDHEPWPFAGISINDGDPPKRCSLSTAKVAEGREEGWIEVEGEELVHRPGGPAANPWASTHTFVQFETLIFKTLHGDVRYRVVRNADKEGEAGDPEAEVRWYYELELEA
jgi:hypothetical protein